MRRGGKNPVRGSGLAETTVGQTQRRTAVDASPLTRPLAADYQRPKTLFRAGYEAIGAMIIYLNPDSLPHELEENVMARGEQRSNGEKTKPRKEKIKTIAAAPSQKGAGASWQPSLGSDKKK
jgi:hypothetical protein